MQCTFPRLDVRGRIYPSERHRERGKTAIHVYIILIKPINRFGLDQLKSLLLIAESAATPRKLEK